MGMGTHYWLQQIGSLGESVQGEKPHLLMSGPSGRSVCTMVRDCKHWGGLWLCGFHLQEANVALTALILLCFRFLPPWLFRHHRLLSRLGDKSSPLPPLQCFCHGTSSQPPKTDAAFWLLFLLHSAPSLPFKKTPSSHTGRRSKPIQNVNTVWRVGADTVPEPHTAGAFSSKRG